tara:strand:- start:195 stop:530 length:336 start_codon:yes stop_codon:yes gene_type:complete
MFQGVEIYHPRNGTVVEIAILKVFTAGIKMNQKIKNMITDTQILDEVIQKCIDNTEKDWKSQSPVDAFTEIAWFIMSKRKAAELGVDVPTSPDAENFWKEVDKLQDISSDK